MITCDFDNWIFADQQAFIVHIEKIGTADYHRNPEHVATLHWNSQAWELIPAVLDPPIAAVSARKR